MAAVHTEATTIANVPYAGSGLLAPFAPRAPSATQSRHAECSCSTNASPSGLFAPCTPYASGFTTGVSQPSDEKCAAVAANADGVALALALALAVWVSVVDAEEDVEEEVEAAAAAAASVADAFVKKRAVRQRSAKGR